MSDKVYFVDSVAIAIEYAQSLAMQRHGLFGRIRNVKIEDILVNRRTVRVHLQISESREWFTIEMEGHDSGWQVSNREETMNGKIVRFAKRFYDSIGHEQDQLLFSNFFYFLSSASSEFEAKKLVRSFLSGFEVGSRESADYLTDKVVKILMLLEEDEYPESIIEELFALLKVREAFSEEKDFLGSTVKTYPEADELDKLLSAGEFNLNEGGYREALKLWSRVANQKGEEVPLPDSLTFGAIERWTQEVLGASLAAESAGKAPYAYVFKEGDNLLMGWEGIYTPDRFVQIMTYKDKNRKPMMRWYTATGKASRFLGIERVLAANL